MSPRIKQTDFGVYVMVDDTHLSRWVEQERRLDHARHLIAKFRRLIPPGATVVDVGAMIGDHTITYAQLVGPSGKVFAIEANPDVAECCMLNMKPYPWVTVLCLALGDKRGSVALERNSNVGASYVKPGVEIPCTTLDSLDLRWCNFVKVDIEGYEPKFLDGATETIKKLRPAILMEVNEGALSRQGFTPDDIFRRLRDLGYRWKAADGELGTPQYDIIATA